MGDFFKLAMGGEVDDVVAAVVEVVGRCGRRSRGRCCPPTTPERATDFFADGERR